MKDEYWNVVHRKRFKGHRTKETVFSKNLSLRVSRSFSTFEALRTGSLRGMLFHS